MRHQTLCPFCGFLFNYLFAQDGVTKHHHVICPGCDKEIPRPETAIIFSAMRGSGDPYGAGLMECKEDLRGGGGAYMDVHFNEETYTDPMDDDWEIIAGAVAFLEDHYSEDAAITVVFPMERR